MKPIDPNAADFDELLSFLSVLYEDGFTPISRWRGGNEKNEGVYVMPWPEYNRAVEKFFELAAKECWADFGYATKDIGNMIHDPQKVASATLPDIKTMLTWCVRGERFCDGHWAGVIQDGCIRNILLRLRTLRPS